MKNNGAKDYLRLGGVLLAITTVVALMLSFFNSLTAGTLTEAEKQAKIAAMQAVLPAAASFEPSADELPEGSVTEFYYGYDAEGRLVGYCVTIVSQGYGGPITMMAGVDTGLSATGVRIISHSESPGFGANADDPSWLSQFVGKVKGMTVVKSSPEGNEIQAVTGATGTSKTITEAINAALEAASGLQKEGK